MVKSIYWWRVLKVQNSFITLLYNTICIEGSMMCAEFRT